MLLFWEKGRENQDKERKRELLLTYRASKRRGSIWPAKTVGATAQYLKHCNKENIDYSFISCS